VDEATKIMLAKVTSDLTKVTMMVRTDTTDVVKLNDHVALIRHFNDMRIAMDQIKEARKALEEMTDHLSAIDVPDVMRNAGIKTTTIEGVGRVTVSHRFSCSILDKDKGYDWLRSTGNGSLITETVNSSTLAAFAKNKLEVEGVDLPPDLFKVGTNPYTSITKVA